MKLRQMIFTLALLLSWFGSPLTVSAQQPGGPSLFGSPPPPYTSVPGPPSANISNTPVEINFDYADTRGEFSKYIFTVTDAPIPMEEGFKLAKEANFQAIAMMQFLNPPELSEEKARLLSKYNLEGVIYWEIEAMGYLPENELKQKIDQLVNRIDTLRKKYPNLKINTFLFGNEPDVQGAWKGTVEQFFQNYATFVQYMKSKNKDYVVGGPGFAPGPKHFQEMFFNYLYGNRISIDFISFHSYGGAVKPHFADTMNYYRHLLQKYPVKSPLFGTPKLANNEYDLLGHALGDGKNEYFKEMDTTWRAAHNIMGLMALVKDGIWLTSEFAGPFRIVDPSGMDVDLLWVKKDGTIKPVYYAHKAFNALAGTIQIAQQGSNFETFGALGGKSKDAKTITVVLANYDELGLRHAYPQPGPASQSRDAKIYRQYKINLRNLPWSKQDKITLERFIVNDHQKLSRLESTVIQGGQEISIERSTDTPEIQLLMLKKQ